jgi:hypothetical protein
VATLSTTKLYGKNGPMVEDLRELLAAWYVSRVDEGMGYVSRVMRSGQLWESLVAHASGAIQCNRSEGYTSSRACC